MSGFELFGRKPDVINWQTSLRTNNIVVTSLYKKLKSHEKRKLNMNTIHENNQDVSSENVSIPLWNAKGKSLFLFWEEDKTKRFDFFIDTYFIINFIMQIPNCKCCGLTCWVSRAHSRFEFYLNWWSGIQTTEQLSVISNYEESYK